MEDVMKMSGADAAADKAQGNTTRVALLDFATMFGFLAGVVGIISLVYGDFSLLP